MDRRSFFQTAVFAFGIFGLTRILKVESASAQKTKVKARAGGKANAVFATEDSLKGLPKASGLTPANFWEESDKPPTVQNFCNASSDKNPVCGAKRQAGQFCGRCTFLQERVNYEDNVAGKCQLIPPKAPKTNVRGHYYCASFVENKANKYDIKA